MVPLSRRRTRGSPRLAEEVSRRASCPACCAFLETAQPDLGTAIAKTAAAGAVRIVVMPYFLVMGVHVRADLPRLVEQQRALFPKVEILVAESLGKLARHGGSGAGPRAGSVAGRELFVSPLQASVFQK